MSSGFTVRFSDLDIGVENRYEFMRTFCRDYTSDASPCFSVRADNATVEKQMGMAEEPITPEYAEALQLYREMAERLPLYGRAVFHGAAIEYHGKAYLFTGPSGIGKTTHIRLWRQFLGEDVQIINGDKPILRSDECGITVYGSPYSGKEGWHRNTSSPLGGICFLVQGKENAVTVLTQSPAFSRLYRQIYKPRTEEAMVKTVEILRRLSALPCYELICDISEEAVKASFTALTGMEYKEKNQ